MKRNSVLLLVGVAAVAGLAYYEVTKGGTSASSGMTWKPITGPVTLSAGTPIAIVIPNATAAEITFASQVGATLNNAIVSPPGSAPPPDFPADGYGNTAVRIYGTAAIGGPVTPAAPAIFWAKS